MEVVELSLRKLKEAAWNPNQMDGAMLTRLKESLRQFGVVENLVVRPLKDDCYEVLSGNQRLKVLRDLCVEAVPCVVVELDDAHAKLLAQALNRIQGEDDLGLRAELVRKVLAELPQTQVTAILPETADSLRALASLGEDSMAEHLRNWEEGRRARLKHLIFQLTDEQLELVGRALERITPEAREARGDGPNTRGTALYLLCKHYLESGR